MPATLKSPAELLDRPNVSLSAIREPIEDDLKAFRSHFRDAMRSDVRLLDYITRYVLRRKGKQLRPILVLLSARAAGGINDRSYTAAALVELLHTATLVHDDVVDEAERRRGMFSINAIWKNKIAVLLGDFLLSRGLLLALDHGEYDLLHTMSDAVRRMSEGELLQIEKARRQDIDEETYFRIISDKTASLLAACTASGAQSATDDPDIIQNLRLAGEALGLAFQIRDDLFDYGLDDVGKPLGLDLQERKMTLPLILALEKGNKSDQRRIRTLVRKKKKTGHDISEIHSFVRTHDGIEAAQAQMMARATEAAQRFASLPPTPARESLLDVTAYVVARSK